jgi:LysM repeat protein
MPTITVVPTIGPTATPFVHIVEKDDTLLGIAIRYGISLEDLLAANPGINPTILSIDQRIIIPGPEGDQDSTLLPDATPLPLTLSEVRCYSTQTGSLWCISNLTNDEVYAIEGVSALFSLLDKSGNVIESQAAFSPLNSIPQGEVVPLSVYFPNPAIEYTFAVAIPISAYPAISIEDRYLSLELDLETDGPAMDGKSWHLSGRLLFSREDERVADHITIFAMAFDREGFIIGFRKLTYNVDTDAGTAIPFDFSIFSLGPNIDHVKILTEAMVSVEVE